MAVTPNTDERSLLNGIGGSSGDFLPVRGEFCWPSAGTVNVRPRGESVAVYGEFRVVAVNV